MLQLGRNLLDAESGTLASKRYLIIDRDAKYPERFRDLLDVSGIEVIELPPMSPNLNAYAERFVRSIKEECLERMIFVGQASLRRSIASTWSITMVSGITKGYRTGLFPEHRVAANNSAIERRSRLGGMLNSYHRVAA